jgi:hypothetical protein
MKKVLEYGCIRVGQIVKFSKLIYLPTNIFERLTIHNTSTDFLQFVGKVIEIQELSSCGYATVQHPSGSVFNLSFGTSGRGAFGSLKVIRDCYQLQIA